MPSTIRDIARVTGFSTATVSRVLSGKANISEGTKKKVEEAAKQLKYQPVPLLSKALSLARQPQALRFRETLALIVESDLKKLARFEREIHTGANVRAQSMGYKVEPFYVSGRPSDHKRVSRILRARGIRGIIIAPRVRHTASRLLFDWEHFAGVEIGRTIWVPNNLHRVERPIYFELIDAYHILKKVGFRRIGLAIAPYEDKQRRGIYTASYLMAQQKLPARNRLDPMTSGEWSQAAFSRWFKRWKPDVIIMGNPAMDAQGVRAWIEKMKLKVPEDISLFSTNVGESNLSGFASDLHGIGAACVEMLSLLLDRNEVGLSSQPRSWLLQDHWQPGTTLRYPIATWHFQQQNEGRPEG